LKKIREKINNWCQNFSILSMQTWSMGSKSCTLWELKIQLEHTNTSQVWQNIQLTLLLFSQSIGKVQAPKSCELCLTDTNIKWRCLNCQSYICEKCKNIHQRVQTTIDRLMVNIFSSYAL
jgi:hypothetical protein